MGTVDRVVEGGDEEVGGTTDMLPTLQSQHRARICVCNAKPRI